MPYLRIDNANLVKEIGRNPIYEYANKYYVGIESIAGFETEIENCIEYDSLDEAEKFCHDLPQFYLEPPK